MGDLAGSITLAPRVVERIAARAAADAAREYVHEPRPGARARAQVAGRRARIEISTAAYWPEPADAVAGRIAERVRSALSRFAGVDADHVTIAIDDVLFPTAVTARKVR
ncbi:hypothetical protein [Ruania halotolerans]|uniref:hypothetical protein n=1 Tax=Ruania halotolerans TaxID=2897773 RepID=UPI001E59F9E9|nr:hypothetical protein [Ruania halotolerans]UFU06673.1 hypothetical protein LQF10_00745 [Ruania halotolerans]